MTKTSNAVYSLAWYVAFKSFVILVLTRISQIVSPVLACDLRYTLEKQRCSAKACHADRGTQWVTAKTRICGSVLTAA